MNDDPFAAPGTDDDESTVTSWTRWTYGRTARLLIATAFLLAGVLLQNGWIAMPGMLILAGHRAVQLWHRYAADAVGDSFWDD